MHVCRCGPGGRSWQPTTGFMTMHVCHCEPGGRSWQLTTGFMTMHVCRCGPGGRSWQLTTGFMTMHAVTCRLITEYGSAPVYNTRPTIMGLYLNLTFTMNTVHVL